jgi:hypothetical protein
MQKTLKNYDKGLVIIKGQLNKVQHENQNLSNNLTKAKHAAMKTKNLQQEYVEVNQPNWKTHNDLNCLQIDLE